MWLRKEIMNNEIIEITKKFFNSSHSDWVQRENDSSLDIEKCNGVAVADAETRSCALCVALNRTIFKKNNMPTFTHPRCKCVFKGVYLSRVTIDFKMEKLSNYLFVNEDKYAMMRSMGYDKEDIPSLYLKIYNAVETEFLMGNYKLKNLDEYGQRIAVPFILEGKRYCLGKNYRCHVGCVVWPNGKIKITTPIVKDGEQK